MGKVKRSTPVGSKIFYVRVFHVKQTETAVKLILSPRKLCYIFYHHTDIYYRSKVNLVNSCHKIISTLGNYRYLVKFSTSYCLRDAVIL